MRAMIEIRSDRKGKNSITSRFKPSIGSLSKSVSLEQSPKPSLEENKRSPSKEKKEKTTQKQKSGTILEIIGARNISDLHAS
jgi:hypothetical protein